MEIKINNQAIKIPQSWNECTESQLAAIFNYLYNEKLNLVDARLSITKMFLQQKPKFFKKWQTDAAKDFFTELNEVINSCTDWIFQKTDDNKIFIKGGLTKIPIQKIRIKKQEFHGPSSNLSNITVLEFAYLETFFERVRDPKQMRFSLNQLIAVLYRPSKPKTPENLEKKYEGDIRQTLEGYEAVINDRAYNIQYLEQYKKFLILHFYESCRSAILESLHPRMRSSSPSHSSDEKKINGWVQIIMELAGGKFGDINQTGNTNLLTVIEYLNLEQRKIANIK